MKAEALNEIKEMMDGKVETTETVDVEPEAELESPDGDGEDTQLQSVDDTDGDAGDSAEGDDADESEDAVEGELDTYTPKEFAEEVGLTVDELYNSIAIPLDDGSTLTMGEIKNALQDTKRDNTKLSEQLVEATKAAENVQATATQSQQASDEIISFMGELSQINRVEESTNWNELEELDPSEALLKRDKIRRAREEVEGKIGQARQAMDAQNQQYLQQAREKMLELIPEWKDETTFKTDTTAMSDVMRGAGFTDAEIGSVIDPRQMVLMKRLAELEAKDKAASSAVKTVRKAPKAIKGRSPRPVSKGEKFDTLKSKAQKTGNKEDQMAAMKAALGVK